MSYCACFTLPTGVVAVVRPNPVLITALQAPTFSDCLAILNRHKQGLSEAVVAPLYNAMATRTEQEAVRIVAKRDAPRTAEVHGFRAMDATDLSVMEATGLLNPIIATKPENRRWRNCWRRIGIGTPAVDMPMARAQRMNEVREKRAPKFTKSNYDLLYVLVDSPNTPMQNKLKDYRQKLRDLPTTEQPNVDALATPEQLAAWEPTWPVDPAL